MAEKNKLRKREAKRGRAILPAVTDIMRVKKWKGKKEERKCKQKGVKDRGKFIQQFDLVQGSLRNKKYIECTRSKLKILLNDTMDTVIGKSLKNKNYDFNLSKLTEKLIEKCNSSIILDGDYTWKNVRNA
jgi:hypothetical protein